jgi:hypothetical protein
MADEFNSAIHITLLETYVQVYSATGIFRIGKPNGHSKLLDLVFNFDRMKDDVG